VRPIRVITRTSRTESRPCAGNVVSAHFNGPGRKGQDEDSVMRLGAETAPKRADVGNPGTEFDLKPNVFTARIPGHDEPFRAVSLCKLMEEVERWASEECMARLLFGAEPTEHRDTTDDRLLFSSDQVRRQFSGWQ
jgi:hypothetical protein